MKVSASANGLGTFGEFSIDTQSMQMSQNVLCTSQANNLTEKTALEDKNDKADFQDQCFTVSWTSWCSISSCVKCVQYLLHLHGGKNLCYGSTEPQLGHSRERDENLQLSSPTEAQLILSSILMKWTFASTNLLMLKFQLFQQWSSNSPFHGQPLAVQTCRIFSFLFWRQK